MEFVLCGIMFVDLEVCRFGGMSVSIIVVVMVLIVIVIVFWVVFVNRVMVFIDIVLSIVFGVEVVDLFLGKRMIWG